MRSASRSNSRRRSSGGVRRQPRECGVGRVDGPVDLARSRQGDLGIDLSGARVDVVVDAAASYVHALAGDVQVDGGTGYLGHGAPFSEFGVGPSAYAGA